MAITRHSTGSSRPRVFATVDTAPSTTRRKRTTKPKSKTTTSGRVTKKTTAATDTHHKRKPSVADKVKGAGKKIAGAVERKPGKKGKFSILLISHLPHSFSSFRDANSGFIKLLSVSKTRYIPPS